MQINETEYKQPIKAPGPAFECNYDNKYKEDTAFGTQKGRNNEALKINNQTADFLNDYERAEHLSELKETNIKFGEILQPRYTKGKNRIFVDHDTGRKQQQRGRINSATRNPSELGQYSSP